jgi:hypothetical protein
MVVRGREYFDRAFVSVRYHRFRSVYNLRRCGICLKGLLAIVPWERTWFVDFPIVEGMIGRTDGRWILLVHEGNGKGGFREINRRLPFVRIWIVFPRHEEYCGECQSRHCEL